jgi:hypothetical protein
MKKSTSERLERLRKARSINDVVSVIQEIAKEIRGNSRIVTTLVESLSATVPNVEEIEIDHSGRTAAPKKIKLKSPKTSGSAVGVKLSKYVAPPTDAIAKHVRVISDLHDNIAELESAQALVKQAFAKAKNQKQVLAKLAELHDEVQENMALSFDALTNIAHKHLPSEMDQLGDALFSYLMDHIKPNSFTNMSKEVYVHQNEDGDILFSLYILIHDLTAKTGFVYDEFFVILTGVVNAKGIIHFHLNTMPDFKIPGKFPIGKEITSTHDMNMRVATLIAHNDISADLDRLPIALDTNRTKTSGMSNITNVDDTYVLDDSLFVIVSKGKATPRNIANISSQVIPLLNRLVGNIRGAKGTIVSRQIERKGHKVIQYILTPSTKNPNHTLNQSRLQEVQELLGLSEAEVSAVKEILKQKS